MAVANPNIHIFSQASEALADAVEDIGRSVVAVHASRHGASSGVIWRSGVVVTAAHTVRRDDGIRITLPDGSRVDAQLAGVDASTDVAALKFDAQWPDAAGIGDATSVRAGHFLFAVARDAQGQSSASFGIVAAVGGEWRTWRGGHIDRLIRLDGRLYTGFSGGPIGDGRGQVIGIGTAALSRHFGIVIPSSTVSRVVEQLLTSGRVRVRGSVDFMGQNVRGFMETMSKRTCGKCLVEIYTKRKRCDECGEVLQVTETYSLV